MISTIIGTSSKRSKLNIFLIAGTLTAVLVGIFFINRTETDSPVFNQQSASEVNQVTPQVPAVTSTPLEEPPVLWLQASGSCSGNAAWGYAVVAPFDTLWSLSTGRELFSPPAIVGQMIFIAGNDKVLRAINMNTGQQVWSKTVTCGLSGGVAADSTNVYFSGQDGYMYALNMETGSEEWKTGLGFHIFTDACVVADSLVLAGNSKGSIAALDRLTGSLVWSYTVEGLLLGPAISNEVSVFSTESGTVGAWDIQGNSIWLRNFTTQPSAPSIKSDVVYLGFSSGKILALSLLTGETIWESSLSDVQGRTVVSRPALTNDSLLVSGTCDNRVFCMETTSGEILWETELENWVAVTPAVCDTIVYASCDDNRMYLLSLNTGLVIDTIETGSYSGTPPILMNGTLFIGNSAGDFVAISGTEPSIPLEEE